MARLDAINPTGSASPSSPAAAVDGKRAHANGASGATKLSRAIAVVLCRSDRCGEKNRGRDARCREPLPRF